MERSSSIPSLETFNPPTETPKPSGGDPTLEVENPETFEKIHAMLKTKNIDFFLMTVI